MTFLKTPFNIGKLKLRHNIFYAPLAGCSDYPFRQMSAKYGPGLMYCEMVKMDALVRNDPHTFHILDFAANMHPIGAQLCGSKPQFAAQCARMVEDMGFDVLDLNCGCPVDKVTKDGSGSGMLKTPELIGEILSIMVATVKIPVTVKVRAGWDHHLLNAPLITEIAEQAGAAAICIHGRTREQGYKGPADWEIIKECKRVARNIKVIGNGDVIDGPSAEKIFTDTGCDAVLVARGTMGSPWAVEDIISHLAGNPSKERTFEECREALIEHMGYISDYHNDQKAIVDIRRVGCWYLKKNNGTRSFREAISRVDSLEKAWNIVKHFSFEEKGIAEKGSTDDVKDVEKVEAVDCVC